jgi:hypothetical protein
MKRRNFDSNLYRAVQIAKGLRAKSPENGNIVTAGYFRAYNVLKSTSVIFG